MEDPGLKKFAEFLSKSEKPGKVSKAELDYWSVKGLDGISEMIRRHKGEVSAENIKLLERSVILLEEVAKCARLPYTDNLDHFIFQGLLKVCQMIHYRAYETGLGPIEAKELPVYIQRLKIALIQIKDGV